MATTKIVLLSDSTNRWFGITVAEELLPARLYERYGRTVTVRTNPNLTGSYGSETLLHFGGTGADKIELWNGAVGGTNWDDIDASELQTRVTDVSPDLVLIAYGINGGADGIEALVDDVQAAVPSTTVVMLSQNPITSDSGAPTRRDYIEGVASDEGLTFIDVYQVFINLGNWEAYLSDGTHPNDDGYAIYADLADSGLYTANLLGPEQGPPEVTVLSNAEAYYRANRYSGTGDWIDESGNGHDAVPSGSPTWDGEKFTLDGSTQLFTVADAPGLDPGTGDFTVVVVAAAASDIAANGYIVAKRAGAIFWNINYLQSSSRPSMAVNDGTDTASASAPSSSMPPAIRATVAMRLIRASDDLVATIDGTDVIGNAASIDTVTSAHDMLFGAWGVTGGDRFKGDIYGVAIFTTALSDDDVATAGAELVASPATNRMGGTGAIRKPPRYA